MPSPIEFAHLQIPLKEIIKATNSFDDKNLIGQGGFGKVYKGTLSWSGQSSNIVARRLHHDYGQGDIEFWTEVMMLASLKHENMVSIVGFCDENNEKIIINKWEAKGSLDKYLSSPKLTWMQRLQICVDVAHALRYIHYDAGHDLSVIHRNVKSSKILLDENWKPKLYGFQISLKNTRARRHRILLAEVMGTIGYVDPTYEKTGFVTHKSDVYSLGAVLFEVLCGKRAFYPDARVQEDISHTGERTKSLLSKSLKILGALPIIMTAIKEWGLLCNGTRPAKSMGHVYEHERRLNQFATQTYEGKLDEMPDPHVHTKVPTHSPSSGDGLPSSYTNVQRSSWGKPSSYTNVQPSSMGQPSSYTNVQPSSMGQPSSFTNVQPSSFGQPSSFTNIQPSSFGNRNPSSFGKEKPVSVNNKMLLEPSNIVPIKEISPLMEPWKPNSILPSTEASNSKKPWKPTKNILPIIEISPLMEPLKLTTILPFKEASSSSKKKPTNTLPIIETSSSKEQHFLLHPLFTMKRLDQYIHSPDEELLAQLAKSHYEEGNLVSLINEDLRKQMDPQSFNIFSETAYSCLKEQRSQRPNIDQIVIKLEKALELQRRHEIRDHSRVDAKVEGTSSNHLKGKNLGHMEIPLIDIKLATNNFADAYLIGSGTYGKVYKAKLNLPIEENTKDEISYKRKRTVAIKRILIREDKHGKEGFVAEIDLLTSCKHPNIVSLLGFCHEGSHMILVYEFASNGSLGDYLGSTSNLIYLTWAQRIKICMDIARGLDYLHTRVEDERRIIHRDIKSDNILLGKNWEGKIADFGLSRFHPEKDANTFYTNNIAGTDVYLDPEYETTGKLKKETDIYSFGVVLFEILSGKIANDPIYIAEDNKGLAPYARRRFKEGKIIEMVDPKIMEEVDELNSTLNKGPNQDSLNTFSKIAHQCLAETQVERPTAEVVMKELEKALSFQENHKDNLQISLQDIKMATRNFSHGNLIGGGGFGKVYKGQLTHANGNNSIVAKRLDKSQGQGEHEFLTELEILFEFKHENIIGLAGYCNEKNEKIIVYEHALNGSLDKHLRDVRVTWMKRLMICIDVASGLAFLHGGTLTKEMVIHRDIKSANILVNDDWKAKISDFGLSLILPIDQEMEYVISNLVGTIGYVDPLYKSTGFLTKESDIYSLGVVLFEILYGKLLVPNDRNYDQQFVTRILNYIHDEAKLDWIVSYGIRKQIAMKSLSTFRKIVSQCLDNDRKKRPTAEEVLRQLNIALEYQEDYEIWEPKLPEDYKEIIQMSKSPEIYTAHKKKELCNIFSKGILLQEGKVWFSLGNNGERNVLISASEFSYINNHSLHEWKYIPDQSKFEKVAEMLDTTNLMIKIETRNHLLTPHVMYGVHLLFKFCDSRKVSSKPTYVNLKYRRWSETLHAYFATWRDDNWMTIELSRFFNQKEDTNFMFILESFSTYYCGDEAIYVEGLEFRAIHNAMDHHTQFTHTCKSEWKEEAFALSASSSPQVKHEEIDKKNDVQQVLESNMNADQVSQVMANYDEGEKLFSLTEVNGKKHLMLPAKATVQDFPNVKLFTSKPLPKSRFQEVVELLPQQIFRINCTIKSHMLSPDTDYACYLVFKLSEKCSELHFPVKLRDLLQRKNEEAEIIYFVSPGAWNIQDFIKIPKQREDGLMEVNLWKFNSKPDLRNDCLPMNLKLTSYEGTMSGLIVCGLEFRPM